MKKIQKLAKNFPKKSSMNFLNTPKNFGQFALLIYLIIYQKGSGLCLEHSLSKNNLKFTSITVVNTRMTLSGAFVKGVIILNQMNIKLFCQKGELFITLNHLIRDIIFLKSRITKKCSN